MESLNTMILVALLPGCALGETVYNEVKPYAPSVAAFKQALNKHRDDGLVQSKQYTVPGTKGARALYALTEDGSKYLAENQKYSPDEIRTSLPARNMVAHELAVAEIVRTIRWEMSRIPYAVKYYDDTACKQNKRHLELSGWYPDLLLIMKRVRNSPFAYRVAIEVDMGSRKLGDVVHTVLGRTCLTLFVCSRMDRLLDLRQELAKYKQLHGLVYFALLCDFCDRPGGVFSCDWINLRKQLVGLYPQI